MKNNNKELWANERKIHNLKYPDENVIRFLYKYYANSQSKDILDFGCGSGRNTTVMAELGMNIYAMDYNKECLQLTSDKLTNYKNIKYIQNKELEVPLSNDSVDCVVAWGALFYQSRLNELKLLKELSDVLKPNGLLLADYRTKEDYLYGRGKEIENDFFILDESCNSLSGISYAFRDIEELEDIYSICGMTIIDYEKKNHYTDKCKRCNSHYIIIAKKLGD